MPSAHMRCMMTAIRRATATIARFIPLSHDHLTVRVSMTWAAANSVVRVIASPHFGCCPSDRAHPRFGGTRLNCAYPMVNVRDIERGKMRTTLELFGVGCHASSGLPALVAHHGHHIRPRGFPIRILANAK